MYVIRAAVSAQNLHGIADTVEWRVVIQYLDDYLISGVPFSPQCAKALRTLLEIFMCLGQ
jgi:hypothetical protein